MAEVLIPGIHDPNWHVDITCKSEGSIHEGCGATLRVRRSDLFIHQIGGLRGDLVCCYCDSCGNFAPVANHANFYRSAFLPKMNDWRADNPAEAARYDAIYGNEKRY